MADKKKKLSAALAAVSFYLQQEEAMALEQQAASFKANKGAEYSPWGQSGSQEMMTMRKLIQLRAFTRF